MSHRPRELTQRMAAPVEPLLASSHTLSKLENEETMRWLADTLWSISVSTTTSVMILQHVWNSWLTFKLARQTALSLIR
jgi:hypothetical protein